MNERDFKNKKLRDPRVERFIIYIYITRGEGQRHGLEEAALRDLQVTLTAENTVLRDFQMEVHFSTNTWVNRYVIRYLTSILNF